jgi:hypothetical protein
VSFGASPFRSERKHPNLPQCYIITLLQDTRIMLTRLSVAAAFLVISGVGLLSIYRAAISQEVADVRGDTAAQDEQIPLAALADPAYAGIVEPVGFTPVSGTSLPVRDTDELDFSEKSKKVPIEVYRDEDFQSLLYITREGDVAAVPYRKNFELRTLSSDKHVVAIRFSPTTAISWRLDELEWKPLAESGDVPVGSYEIKYMESSDGFVVLRLDQFSGAVWYLDPSDTWQLTGEGAGSPSADTAPEIPTPDAIPVP